MKRTFIFFALLIYYAVCPGQVFNYPNIQQKGRSINDFIPPGWMILDSAKGDLNKDGIKDEAIILQHKDSVRLTKPDYPYDTLLTQPRILIILFSNASGNEYSLAAQSNSFILNHDNAIMDDPYQDIKIEKGVMRISFQLFYSMGSWYVTNSSYAFRYQDKKFVLIGADYFSFHRATHDSETYSFNFLGRKRSYTKSVGEAKGKTTWKTLPTPKLQTLQSFKEPFSWEVEKDLFL